MKKKKKNEALDLSIVIVSTNIEELLRKCLQSLVPALKGIKAEVIVVDNASKDKTPQMVETEFPWVKLIKKHRNRGFGANNNIGMKVARGRYVLLLNSDTELLDKVILKEMVAWMDKHPKVGLSSCALLNEDRKTLQGNGGYFPTLFKVFFWMFFLDDIPGLDRLIKPFHPLHEWSPIYKGGGYFKKTQKQDWLTAAYLVIRKSALDEAGLFDEDFFLYVEEVDLSYRFVKAGWEVWYLPKWKILHYGQVTIGSENSMIFELKNMVLFYKKHFSSWKIPIVRVVLKTGAVLRMIIFGILKGPKVTKTYAKAFKEI